jgi:hypothetical protein
MTKKYALPAFLQGVVSEENYEIWLSRKTNTHIKRDRERGNEVATRESYRIAIHDAVTNSLGLDAYTGEQLDWSLLSQYDNKESQAQGRAYKHRFGLLPTLDHVGDGTGNADFLICGWRTNDAKNDLSLDDFHELCRKVLVHAKKPLSAPVAPHLNASTAEAS